MIEQISLILTVCQRVLEKCDEKILNVDDHQELSKLCQELHGMGNQQGDGLFL